MAEKDIAVAQIESLAPDGRRLRVEFLQLPDRYGHRLVIVEADGRETVALQSIELTPDDDSPEHPALQSLHIQPLADREGSLAALVGMSGTNHWSLSVEPDAEMPGRLIFDAACRMNRVMPPRLASHYEVAASAEPGGVSVELLPVAPQPNAIRIDGDIRRFAITCELTPADVPPTTLRWRYAIGLRQRF